MRAAAVAAAFGTRASQEGAGHSRAVAARVAEATPSEIAAVQVATAPPGETATVQAAEAPRVIRGGHATPAAREIREARVIQEARVIPAAREIREDRVGAGAHIVPDTVAAARTPATAPERTLDATTTVSEPSTI